MTVDDYIKVAYDRMKAHIQKFCDGRGLIWSEDIYHDTILKMRDIEQRQGGMKDPTVKGMDNYLFMAYRTNALRELQYPRVSRTTYTDNLPESQEESEDADGQTPSSRLVGLLRDAYGDELTELYLRRTDGGKMRELVHESGRKDLKEVFQNMEEHARHNRQYILHGN